MNPRRVHELMREHFPERPASASDWVVASDERGLRVEVVRGLVREHIPSDQLVVEVQRKVGSRLPVDEALAFIARHVGQGRIQVSDREFRGFVVVESTGVACGWST